ncbi:MAG: Rne/Rng family ribonuclease [Polyangiaceae bacterium]|nr:Rne/Rng family ribonuclease [Polyangiaceae bacterium]
MAKNILVISCDIRETRAALIENGIIAELHIERQGRQSSTVGNVYLGKVTRVLPGLQAAFIDIGQERAAFLHVEDLIRPDDFDEYLAGGRKLARSEEGLVDIDESDVDSGEQPTVSSEAETSPAEPLRGRRRDSEASAGKVDLEETVAYPNWPLPPSRSFGPPNVESNGASMTDALAIARKDGEREEGHESADVLAPTAPAASASDRAPAAEVHDSFSPPVAPAAPSSSDEILARGLRDESEPSPDSVPELDEHADDEILAGGAGDDHDESFPANVTSEVRLDHMQPDAPLGDASAKTMETDDDVEVEDDDDDLLDDDDLPGFTVSEPGEPIPRAPAPARTMDRNGDRGSGGDRGGRRRRGRGRRGAERVRGADARGGRGGERRGGGSGDRGGRAAQQQSMPGRISKSTPIREVVREGQEIIVQVTKDPIGTKGARCSSHISLPGRYVVYLPTVDHIGISKRIGNDKERARLREAIEAMKPPSGGLIVRTVAEGLTKKGLKQDVGYLVRLWGEIAKKREGKKAPEVLSSELDLVLKVARDLFTDEVHEVVIDDRQQYERLCRFVEMFAPDRVKDVKLYDEEEPIFDEYGIEDEIGRALSRKVPLPSGGYLIIDQAEALTAIDVNTGRFVGKGSKDMEETILKTNLEAVSEIAYQLRFRNIGGLIILDLIDMESHKNREKVRRTLEDLLQKDKAKTTLNRISELGLIEMTRKRTRESLGRLMHEPCFYCDGTGQLQSKETIAYEILREIRRKRDGLPGYSVVVNAHPAVADVLNGEEKEAVAEAENRFMRKILVVPRKEYHLEQFDLQGK